MAHHDRYGLPLSTASNTAAVQYREGVDLLLATWPGASEVLDAAIAADPGFALAHAARARAHAVRGEGAEAAAAIATARDRVAARGTDRERSHVETLSLAIAGRSAEALDRSLSHAETWPRDAIILSLPLGAFGLLAFSGRADHDAARAALCERHAPHYADDWWFLIHRGWSRIENGSPVAGRAIAERGFSRRPANANAAHVLSHAMFQDGAGEEADAFITRWLPDYPRSGPLHGHLSWHQALVALEHGDAARALSIYADRVSPSVSAGAPLVVASDGASLLWRLHAYGHAPPKALWDEVSAYAARAFPTPGLAFMDVHLALIAAATGDRDGVERRAETLATRLADGTYPAGPAIPAICRALLAFADEDHAACARILMPALAEATRIGGSRAQREIIEDTLLVALMRSGAAEDARRLLDTRLQRRPSPRDARWRETLGA